MSQHHYFIVLAGPTGVGKTDMALEIANHLPIEIINADVGQFYMPLTIGTAKPDWKESPIPHHMFDVLSSPENMTVTEYRNRVVDLCKDIWQRGNIPLFVGGSHFYITALFFPPLIHEEVPKRTYTESTQDLWNQLKSIDPDRAEALSPHDRYRIERALTIWHATGIKPSTYKPQYNPIAAAYSVLFLSRDRTKLYERINQRTDVMIQQGWIQEVEPLIHSKWEEFLQEKKLIGYDDIIKYLKKNDMKSIPKLKEIIAQKTRNYAKRQFTYWRMLQEKLRLNSPKMIIETVNLDQSNPREVVKKLAAFISTLYTSDLKREEL